MGIAEKIHENVEAALELSNRQRLDQFEGFRRREENVGKFGDLLSPNKTCCLPRDLLNGIAPKC